MKCLYQPPMKMLDSEGQKLIVFVRFMRLLSVFSPWGLRTFSMSFRRKRGEGVMSKRISLVAVLLFLSTNAFAQSDGLGAVQPFDPDRGYYPNFAAVATSGVGSAAIGETTTGGAQSGIPITEEEDIRRTDQESFFFHTGDYHRMKGSVMRSGPLLGALTANMYTSPLAILMASINLTDSSLGAAFSAANEESHFGATGTFTQLETYLKSLEGLPDELQRKEEFSGCIKRIFDQTTVPMSILDAIKQCTGGFDVAIPDVATNLSSTSTSQARVQDIQNIPNTVGIEKALRAGTTPDPECIGALVAAGTPILSSNDECYERTLWQYIFHHVSQNPILGNETRWAMEDEARLYYGNMVFYERNPKLNAGGTLEPELGAQTASRIRKVTQVSPPQRAVNFYTPDVSTGGFLGFGNTPGYKVPMKGFDLIKAQYLQDIYGSIYALAYKMCDWSNQQATWAKRNNTAGLASTAVGCPLWSAPGNAQWNTSINTQVPGLPVLLPGCQASVPIGPLIDAMPSPYNKIWPDGSNDLLPVNAGGQLWYQKRFYMHTRPGETAKTIGDITIQDLLGNLSAGNVSFSHSDAMMLNNLLRLENPPDDDGQRACTDILEGVALGDIMKFRGPIPVFFGLWSYHVPAGPTWPLKDEFNRTTGGFTGWKFTTTKRVQLLYEYALTAAELKALQKIEHFRLTLRRQVLANHPWADKFDMASQLVARNLPGASHQSTATTTMKIAELSDRMGEIRKALYDYYDELKTRPRFSDGVGDKRNPSAGASKMGVK
ncbi:MAG: hypothetical protein KDD70_00740 [Bdellovibrionales bacterium]|nr:hypothetical protein [Bdellovibrionales bacterium]